MTDHSAQGAYTTTPASIKSDTPTNIVDAFRKDASINDPIKRNVGETTTFDKGRDYTSTRARVITSMYSGAADDEKAIYLNQGKGGAGISISLQTLKELVAWAEGV